MQLILIIVFAILGLAFAEIGRGTLGLSAGALIGYLIARISGLQKQLTDLDNRLIRLMSQQDAARATDSTAAPAKKPLPPAKLPDEPKPVSAPRSTSVPTTNWQPPAEPAKVPSGPGPVDKLFAVAKEWLTTGNVPVKLGVIVFFFGVSFLLKYAVDRQIFNIPLEARYLAVAAGAGILLAIGWRLREKMPTYALSMQGGGIGVLYLTIFAAFRLHALLPATFAFSLLVLLTASVGVLAVLQDARWLAILGTVGGFLAPVLVSTGSGNHVALFSYYLLLNVAILSIAWHKAWRNLSIIGFAFTFGVGTMWGHEYYQPELMASTEPFLVAFFLFYQAIAILFAFRHTPKIREMVDGTLIFGTPVVAFALQARVVEHTEYGLAISAIVVAVLYTIVGTWLHRIRPREMRLLIESYVALSVAFATIAVPLALDDRWTAAAWALEGAALVWIGVRQNGFLARITGIALLAASGIAFMNYGWKSGAGIALLNGNFLGGILISVAALFSSRKLQRDAEPIPMQAIAAKLLFVWGLAWWAVVGVAEIADRLSGNNDLHATVAFTAASAAMFAWLGRRLDWSLARQATIIYLPLLALLGLYYAAVYDHLLVGIGTISWLAATVVHFFVLHTLDDGRGKIKTIWHIAGALLIVAMFSYEVSWRMDEAGFGIVWATSTAMLIPIAATLLITFGRQLLLWPLQRHWKAYLLAATVLVILQLLSIGIVGLSDAGDPVPLPYIPFINPFDLLTVIGLTVLFHIALVSQSTTDWLTRDRYRAVQTVWGLGAFILSTIAVIRGVHNIGNLEWQQTALLQPVAVQAALSIYWAILGLAGMVWGTRHANRRVWIIGTGLMALVVAKLFLIDLGNTGTIARIISFLGVGAMLLVVGYLSPAPPRQVVESNQAEEA